MGPGAPLKRRAILAAGGWALAGCGPTPVALPGGWVGASQDRGHRLRERRRPAAAVGRRAQVLVLGAGVAGLAAARALAQRGIDDVQLLELEYSAGGNSRGHLLAGQACPLGAHYLPLPGPAAREVNEWLFEIGLLRHRLGRTLPDERHLCHSPQERLYFEGAWHDGLLPPAEPGSATLAQYRRFADAVAQLQHIGFSIPSQRSPWTAAHAALDTLDFATWLDRQGLDDQRLRWYLDYCCRDDYGAGSSAVSAWAGVHYFASRHGFHAPGDEAAEREPVFTWPEGNAWLVRRLAAPFADRLHLGRTVLAVSEERHAVQVLAWDERAQRAERWTAARVVLALPLFIAAQVLQNPGDALREAASRQPHAPWLVANLHLARPLVERPGLPLCWDNVPYGGPGLGYVNAGHQRLDPSPGPTLLTAYLALAPAQRAALRDDDWRTWAQRVVDGLLAVHPDLPAALLRADLMRYSYCVTSKFLRLRAGSKGIVAAP